MVEDDDEVEDDEGGLEDGIPHPVEMVEKMEMKSVISDPQRPLDQIENFLPPQRSITQPMQDIPVPILVDWKKMAQN
ncbi:MAG: hypothetical protein Q4B28_03030 [bacterium]|nr:hypothetical protein [bacterium]